MLGDIQNFSTITHFLPIRTNFGVLIRKGVNRSVFNNYYFYFLTDSTVVADNLQTEKVDYGMVSDINRTHIN